MFQTAKAVVRLLPRGIRESQLVRGLRRAATGQFIDGPLTYNQDGLATVHSADFMKGERFARAYACGRETGSWGASEVQWRAHVCCWAAAKARNLEGDFVECGVNRGGLAMTVLTFVGLDSSSKRFFLLDTFNGLVERYISDREISLGVKPGGYEECHEAVRRTFADHPSVVLIRGAVPETLTQVTTKRVAYLSIDMNCMAPEIAAIEFFWNKLVSGAPVVLDDYGWLGHSEQKLAFDAFARREGVEILALPTGQGLILKP
jgi:O-methyltransferase